MGAFMAALETESLSGLTWVTLASRNESTAHRGMEDSPGVDLGTQLPRVLPLALYNLYALLSHSRICEKLSLSCKYSQEFGR